MIREIPQKVEAQPIFEVGNSRGLTLLRRTRTTVFLGCLFAVGSMGFFAPQQKALAVSSLYSSENQSSSHDFQPEDNRLSRSQKSLSTIESARRIRDELRQTKISNTRKSALIDSGAVVHKVKTGDTLAAIAARYEVSVNTLIQTNDLDNPNDIRLKDKIVVPTAQGISLRRRSASLSRSSEKLLIASVDDGAIASGAPQDSIPAQNERTAEHRDLDLEKVRRTLQASLQHLKPLDEKQLALTPAEIANKGLGIRPNNTRIIPASKPGLDLVDIPVAARGPLPNLPDLELPTLDSEKYLPSEWQGVGSVKFIWPAKGTFTSGYGWRWGRMHRGIDIAAPTGTPVVASAAGVVTYSRYNRGGYGNLVEVTHPDGSLTLYAHNDRNLVRQGQFVSQGQKIAEMGSTGRSTGPHTHFELHSPGRGAINPVYLLGKK